MKCQSSILGVLIIAICAGESQGAFITSAGQLSGATSTIDFSQFTGGNQHFGVTGPVQIGGSVGADVTAGSASGDLWLYNAGWGLVGNGSWNSGRQGFFGYL